MEAIVCTCPDVSDVWCCELCRAFARMADGLSPFGCPVHRPDRPPLELEERCDVAARLAGMRLGEFQRVIMRGLFEAFPRETAAPAALAKPCSCRYGWPSFPYTHGSGYPRFMIDPACRHHGDARRWVNLEVAW